ncbi:hypothetical protein B14911_10507 [Bacillus sp. NRRL B-14911]|uniref:hypothetical protein n=1 Tax=Bacillus sp. NRRL B-14911 TaxID=313627 RepID=UPI00006B598D|nr:hypothetical protein [Bacillus sp. NRRL B-14911]EAR66159.1 hypothetical protein B14911_10507 [Bacillus sp. NRRL B-14911]
MVSGVTELYRYWEDEFKKQDLLTPFEVDNNDFRGISKKVRDNFRLNYYPQPFYGYLKEDMSKDMLMPLINPGPISNINVTEHFPAETLEESIALHNYQIYERHTGKWSKEIFHQKEREYDMQYGGRNKHWRGKKINQVRRLLGEDIEFLHTIEFFPFHSDKFGGFSKEDQNKLHNLPSTIRSINALEDIASRKLVKHILGIGMPWANILDQYPSLFTKVGYQELIGPKGGVSQRFYKYKPVRNPDGLPILIYSTTSMNIPNPNTNCKGANIFYEFLEI